MSANDWFGLISTLLAVVSVFVPFIINWIEKKSKLQQSIYFMELIKAKNQLIEIKEEQDRRESSPILNKKLDSLLNNINDEINKNSEKHSINYFIFFVFIEAILFLSAFFFKISSWITRILNGKSYETGIYFLEGIFKSQESRLILMAIFISISIYLTTIFSKKIFEVLKNNLLINFVLLIIFNIVFLIITTIGAIILMKLDPIIPIW
jgi:hypothetical protein